MSENSPVRAGECPVGMLIDLSSPVVEPDISSDNENEDPNATFKSTDCIEISRSDDGDRRLSHTLMTRIDKADRVLKDVTDKVVSNSQQKNSPVMLIEDEIFDFDFMLSPSESSLVEDQEEEVFFGPVGFTEKLVSTVVAQATLGPMSPLRPEQWAEIAQEARSIAHQLSNVDAKSDTIDSKTKSPAKHHQRRGTFELEKPVETLLQDGTKIKIPSIDQENSSPDCEVNSISATSASAVSQKSTAPININSTTKDESKKQISSIASKVNRKSLTNKSVKDNVQSNSLQSKLHKPSKLMQLKKNRSYTFLPKAESYEDINQPLVNIEVSCASDTDSVVSDKSDISASKLHVFRKGLPVVRKNLEAVDALAMERDQLWSGTSDANSDTSSIASDLSDLSISKLPTQSLPVKSSLPSRRSGIPGLGLKKQTAAGRTGIQPVSSKLKPPKSKMPSAKPPISTLQLVRPGQMQNKLAFPRGKPVAVTGPVKALVPTKPVGPVANTNRASKAPHVRSDTSETTPLKQQSPVMMKHVTPLPASRRSLNVRTPVKSTSSSTSSMDTPGRRRSCLPTPTKQRIGSSGSIPPSPLTNRSSTSSTASSRSRKLLMSDGCDSPVFLQSGRNRTATPRRPPVQNTPDMPKKRYSVWSPVTRSQLNSTDQLFQCTKRIADH